MNRHFLEMPAVLFLLAALMFAIHAVAAEDPFPRAIITQQMTDTDAGATPGRRYALRYCQSCHLFTEPDLLPRSVWRDTMLPRMGVRLGMHHRLPAYADAVYFGDTDEEKQLLAEAGVFPSSAQVPEAEWHQLTRYFLDNAPDAFPPEDESSRAISQDLETFEARPWQLGRPPLTTLVRIDEARQQVLFGDGGAMSLVTASSTGEVVNELFTGSPPVDVSRSPAGLQVLAIGYQFPSDLPRGELLMASDRGGAPRFYPGHVLIEGLKRPVNATWADLAGDEQGDILVSEFGHRIGALTLYTAERQDVGIAYIPEVLLPDAGAMATHIRDMDRDGHNDIVVVMGQHREGVFVLYKTESGYLPSWVVQLPPTHGTAHVDVIDFDQDGALDLLVSNGDNGDYTPILKRHHGVRLYRNQGDGTFAEMFFYPLNGAFKSLSRDFDQDGDLDIAVIAMFADYEDHPEQGFVFLENVGGADDPPRFVARTLPDVTMGRWLTMDAGDLDGDGDLDIVLGSFAGLPHPRQAMWMSKGLPILFLENTTR